MEDKRIKDDPERNIGSQIHNFGYEIWSYKFNDLNYHFLCNTNFDREGIEMLRNVEDE